MWKLFLNRLFIVGVLALTSLAPTAGYAKHPHKVSKSKKNCHKKKNRQKCDVKDGSEFDIIIVGSGCAGTVLASRLSENPNVKVAVISSGLYHFEPTEQQAPFTTGFLDDDTRFSKVYANSVFTYEHPMTSATWNSASLLPEIYTKTVLGGGTVGNGREFNRGEPALYDYWKNTLGLDGWGYDDLLPHFKAIETVYDFIPDPDNPGTQMPVLTNDPDRGTSGPLIIYRDNLYTGATQLPLQAYNFECPLPGNFPYFDTYFDPTNCVSDKVFKDPLTLEVYDQNGRDLKPNRWFNGQTNQNTAVNGFYEVPNAFARPNLSIFEGITAQFVLVKKNKDKSLTATGVQLRSGIVLKARCAVIVAAGAEGSPKFLLQSGIGPKRELEKLGITCHCNLPGVGERFADQQAFDPLLIFALETTPVDHQPALPTRAGQGRMNTLYASSVNHIPDSGDLWASWPSVASFSTPNTAFFGYFPTLIVLKHNILGKVSLQSKSTDVPARVTGVYDVLTADGQHLKPFFKQQVISLIRKYWNGLQSSQSQRRWILEPSLYADDPIQFWSTLDTVGFTIVPRLEQPQTNKEFPGVEHIFLYNNTASANVTDEQIEAEVIKYLKINAAGQNFIHYMGSCGMGDIKKDRLAVTDHTMKVHHFTNLYVCDASIIPTQKDVEWFNPDSQKMEKTDVILSPFGGPSCWCYMFGQKLSQQLLDTYSDCLGLERIQAPSTIAAEAFSASDNSSKGIIVTRPTPPMEEKMIENGIKNTDEELAENPIDVKKWAKEILDQIKKIFPQFRQ